jgi:hypothetical protein
MVKGRVCFMREHATIVVSVSPQSQEGLPHLVTGLM